MLKQALRSGIRNLYKYRFFSILNITGLAVGLAATIMILSWTGFHMSFDRSFKNAKNIYRVIQHIPFNEDVTWAITQGPLGEALTQEIPGIVDWSRTLVGTLPMKPDEVTEYNETILFGDPAFIDIFTIDCIRKTIDNPIESRDHILISETLAHKYFGDGDPIGKTISFPMDLKMTVSGVFKDIPKSTHIQFDCIVNFYVLETFGIAPDRWNNSGYVTYVLLDPAANPARIREQMAPFLDSKPTLEEGTRLDLQELLSIHRTTGIDFENASVVSNLYIRLFLFIGIFILLLASINYINLDTAKASKRSREIGIRKINGATPGILVRHFLGESGIIVLIALLVSVALVTMTRSLFHQMTGIDVMFDLSSGATYLKLFALWIVTAFLSGTYPALFLSKLKPVSILNGKGLTTKSGSNLRKLLVVFQFSLALVFIIGTLTIYRQVHYMKTTDLGYDVKNIVYFQAGEDLLKSYEGLREKLLSNPGIELVCRSGASLGHMVNFSNSLWHWPGQDPEEQTLFRCVNIGFDFFETHKMDIVEGRFPSRDMSSDTASSIVINEAAAKMMNLPQTVGTIVRYSDEETPFTILGVVRDFNYKSLHTVIEPQIMILDPSRSHVISCRLSGTNNNQSLDYIRQAIQEILPEENVGIEYLEESLHEIYRDDKITGWLLILFTILSIFVSMLGLTGLMAFVSEQRIPEMGIRKTLGASSGLILRLFSLQYLRLVGIALVISWPVAWFAIQKYLQNFPYRIGVPYADFILSGVAVLFLVQIVLVAVSLKTARKAAIACLQHI